MLFWYTWLAFIKLIVPAHLDLKLQPLNQVLKELSVPLRLHHAKVLLVAQPIVVRLLGLALLLLLNLE